MPRSRARIPTCNVVARVAAGSIGVNRLALSALQFSTFLPRDLRPCGLFNARWVQEDLWSTSVRFFAESFLTKRYSERRQTHSRHREANDMTLNSIEMSAGTAAIANTVAALGFSDIPPVDEIAREAANRRLDVLTKPQGALGRLEPMAAQVCAIQGTLEPAISCPTAIVFAADHGVADRGVSAYPRAVTEQMVKNFLVGGAAISVLAKLQGMELWIVDAGIDGDSGFHRRLINKKIRRSTRDFVERAAMTPAECRQALRCGREVLEQVAVPTANTVILGEMGIGNTAASALLMHGLTGYPIADCVGRGTGLDDQGLARKQATLEAALARQAPPRGPVELLTEFGGYEIAMLTGAILAAAACRMIIIVDGFTVTVAAALAARLSPVALDYCIFGHCSAEHAHRSLLAHLNVLPLLDVGMRLGEGTGAALALSTVRAALALFTDMATFEGAGVSGKDG
jgi:nicotinate-nucleotide--dimethylbenzimidazole phosphoribosyltransferase